MNKVYKLLPFIVMFSLCLSNVQIATAFASTNQRYSISPVYLSEYKVTKEDQEFLDKLASICDSFYFADGKLSIRISYIDLKGKYGFTEKDIIKLKSDVLESTVDAFDCPMALSNRIAYQSSTHVGNGTLYISSQDLKAGSFAILSTAAAAGPAAMAAAINALSNMIPAPVGTIIGVIATAAAAPSLVELCGRVLYANAHNKGIYIRPVMSYPPLEIGYW